MTRKDFVLIAEALRDSQANGQVVRAVADALASTSERFDRQRFTDAALDRDAEKERREEELIRLRQQVAFEAVTDRLETLRDEVERVLDGGDVHRYTLDLILGSSTDALNAAHPFLIDLTKTEV